VCLMSGGLQCSTNLQKIPQLQHCMPQRASGRHCILASSPRAFSRPVPYALAAAHTYRRICQIPCTLPERPSWLACQPLCCSSGLFHGFRLQFALTRLDRCVQYNFPPWAWGDVMCLLRRELEVMVESNFCSTLHGCY